jgi:hypothetical protein
MAKDVNIHVKTEGTRQVQQDLQGVATDVNSVGDNVEQMGSRSGRAMEWFANGIKSLIGPLGFAAIATAVATTAGKIADFFDGIKTRCDESVNRLKEVRKGFQDIFEAMNAFDESSRRQITKDTISLLKETSVPREIGLPVINTYTRQFRGAVESGQITEEQYNRGLKEMLGYAARHNQTGTPELITLMSGWGMVSPEQQGTLRRQIGAVSGKTGLDEEDIVAALGRGMPTIKAMGWTPEQALKNIGILAAGEIGREKLSLPARTMDAMVTPQIQNAEKYGIPENVASQPFELFAQVAALQGKTVQIVKEKASQGKRAKTEAVKMDHAAFMRMLSDIYGGQAAAGIYKLVTSPSGDIDNALRQAASNKSVTAEQTEERTSKVTLERQEAKLDAIKTEEDLRRGKEDVANQSIRAIGEDARTTLRIEQPKMQWYRERFKRENTTKEEAAYRKWAESLTEGEKKELFDEWVKSSTEPDVKLRPEAYRNAPDPYMKAWREMSPIEQYDALTTEQRVPTKKQQSKPDITSEDGNTINHVTNITNNDFHSEHNMIYQLGGNKGIGPRFDRDDA